MALNGKIAVVTGAAQGIGKAITELLLQNGAKVALLDTNKTKGESLKEALDQLYGEQSTLFLHCNVESDEQIKAAFQETLATFGRMDILCNNAGILNEVEWEKTISINLVAVVRFTYLALEHMNEMTGGQGGVIVNTASMAGLGPGKSCPVYTATKHGVVGFTRAMAAASTAAGYGVRFNAVCPGFVQTELLTGLSNKLGQFSQLADEFQRNAEKSTLTVSEVADCLLELVTDETKNGEALQIRYNGKKYMTFPVFT
ncbi:15-hydroxyprostaglandin dehydrogenase [NAD(+)]-like isoform X1 [Notothenia coriiceps]|uniref:15-hydroxyprostaglandin dehydrogenase [NAD(+)] n=1 Tax=Notothenia coriiceps TaxID=8208 RepID=A0A6I9PRH0_9TELE|nr:PREDICTED: 15-hydroxyprostaglandin dehydrogenase [NAD(+)]-like isoform X1 [Notothenia coriiceps]